MIFFDLTTGSFYTRVGKMKFDQETIVTIMSTNTVLYMNHTCVINFVFLSGQCVELLKFMFCRVENLDFISC